MSSLSGDSAKEAGVGSVAPLQSAFSQWLDAFRWIAAFSVVLAHCNNRFLVRITDLPHGQRPFLLYLYTFFAGFAHQAVMVFFVMSGYLVGGSLWKEQQRTGKIAVRRYLLKRVSRLCIVLYPALLLIAALNLIGLHPLHGIATGAYDSSVLPRTGPGALACNAAFLQTAACDTYGNDGALWSLFNEFWYYLLWPMLVLALFSARTGLRVAMTGLFAVVLGVLSLLPLISPLHGTQASTVGAYMVIWLLGVPAAVRQKPFIASPRLAVLLFGLVLLALRLGVRRTLADEHPGIQFVVDLLLGLVFANLLLTLRHARGLPRPPLGARNGLFAGFSFSLYCIHIPILNLYAAAYRYITGRSSVLLPRHAGEWLVILTAIGSSILGGYLFSLLTEAHTLAFRHWLERTLPRFESLASPFSQEKT